MSLVVTLLRCIWCVDGVCHKVDRASRSAHTSTGGRTYRPQLIHNHHHHHKQYVTASRSTYPPPHHHHRPPRTTPHTAQHHTRTVRTQTLTRTPTVAWETTEHQRCSAVCVFSVSLVSLPPSLPPSTHHLTPHTSHLTPHAASVMSDPPPHDTYATSVPSCIGWVRAEAKRAAFVWRFIGCLSRWESFGGGGGGCCCWWWRGVVWARKPLVAG